MKCSTMSGCEVDVSGDISGLLKNPSRRKILESRPSFSDAERESLVLDEMRPSTEVEDDVNIAPRSPAVQQQG